jgi:hypothetical protein
MTDKNQTAIDRAERAKRLLSDEILIEAREHIEAELWRMFKEAGPKDNETLSFVKAMHYFHIKYNAFLDKAVTDGKMARLNIESKKKPLRERFRVFS